MRDIMVRHLADTRRTAEQQITALAHGKQVVMARLALAGWRFDYRRDGVWYAVKPDGRSMAAWFTLSVCIDEAWTAHLNTEATNG